MGRPTPVARMARLSLTLLGGFRGPDRRSGGRSVDQEGHRGCSPTWRFRSVNSTRAISWPLCSGARCVRHRRAVACATPSSPCASPWVFGCAATQGRDVALDPALVEVDVGDFEQCVTEGSLAALERAAALYQGDLLEGLVLEEPSFEEWLIVQRLRLRELASKRSRSCSPSSATRGRSRPPSRRHCGSWPSTRYRSRCTGR